MAAVGPDGVGAARSRSAAAGRSASSRPPAPRSSASPTDRPQDESTPIRPVNPYGAAKAYAHLMVDVYRRRDLHAVSAILYNHESPRRPEQLRDPQDHRHRGRDRAGSGRPAHPRQPRRPARLGLGARLRRRDGARRPGRRSRATTSSPPAWATRVRDFVGRGVPPRRHRRLGARWSTPTPRWSARPTRPTSPATPPAPGATLGWAPTVGFEELVGRMVDADLSG